MIHKYKDLEPCVGEGVFLAESTNIIGDVELGKNVSIWFGAVIRADVNAIKIGQGSNIQDNSTVHVADNVATIVGENVTVGHNCILHGCTIAKNCLIGMGSVILDGACIGENSIVGANSLVTMRKVFPANSLIMGSPAKVIRPLTKEEIEEIDASAKHYMAYAQVYINGMA